MRQATVTKYEKLITHLQERKRGFVSIAKVLRKFNASAGAGKILQNEGLVSKGKNGKWKWTGAVGLPNAEGVVLIDNSDLAKTVISKVNADVMTYVNKPRKPKKSSQVPAIPFVAKKVTAKKQKTSDVISLSALRKERTELSGRIEAIDTLLALCDKLK